MERALEHELKLDPPDAFELPALPGQPLEPRVFTSTYFDTPDHSLTRARITLRRRVENGVSRWQLKLPRGENARSEIEEVGGPAELPDGLRELLTAHLVHGELEPIATLRTRRVGVRVGDDGRQIADVTLDTVEILEEGQSAGGFAELEVELLDGDEDDLERLGHLLRGAGAERSDGRPKVFRVLGDASREPGGGDDSTAERIAGLLSAQLGELEAHDPGTRTGDDPEDLHQFRVATRRARAIIRATKPLVGDSLESLGVELKWLASTLGAVRDLDVLLGHLRDEVVSLDVDRSAGERILEEIERDHARVRAELLQALQSPRYKALLISFRAGAARIRASQVEGELRPLARRAFERLRKAAAVMPADPSDEAMHALRIRAKRARYAAELLEGKKLRRYIAALKEVQDVVGEHQDAVVAEGRIRAAARPETTVAAGRLIERERARRLDRRRAYPDALAATLRRGEGAFN